MTSVADKIMDTVLDKGAGNAVFTPKDFLKLGTRAAVDQALSRLTRSKQLRRIGRGLYDLPRHSDLLDAPAPAAMADVVDAFARSHGITIVPDGISAANGLGLTTAVPAQRVMRTTGAAATIKTIDGTVELRPLGRALHHWVGRPGFEVAQAIHYLGRDIATQPSIAKVLADRLSDSVKENLVNGLAHLPAWVHNTVRSMSAEAEYV